MKNLVKNFVIIVFKVIGCLFGLILILGFFFPPLTEEEKIDLTHKVMSRKMSIHQNIGTDNMLFQPDLSQDSWGTPFRVIQPFPLIPSLSQMISAGPDRMFDTEDDLLSAFF